MSTTLELDAKTHTAIQAHCTQGDALADKGSFEAAIAAYDKAWQLVPDPKTDWEAATWILGAIGDAAFHGGHATTARNALQYAMRCPGGLGNPFLHLRLGEVLFDAGENDLAAD